MLRVAREGHVVVWTVDRPTAKNALDSATMLALAGAIDEAAHDGDVRAAVLTGAGDVFVSGGDLRELRDKTSREDAERLTDLGYRLCHAIGELPFPVVAALGGAAIGGGAELALACDLRVADARATLQLKQARLGVTTSWGTVPRLLALTSAGTASKLLYAGLVLSAEDARAAGLVDEVTPEGAALPRALDLAGEVARSSPAAVAAMKRLVRATAGERADVRALERELFVETWTGSDHLEAVEAHFERRPARFRPR